MPLDCVYPAGKTICCCETDGRTECKYKAVMLPETPGTMPPAFKELEKRAGIPTKAIQAVEQRHGIYPPSPKIGPFRTHTTGASRDLDDGKPDFEAMLSPLVMEAYGAYMTRKRRMADGTLREADNWKKGMPLDWFIKSGWRHMVDWWKHHRKEGVTTETIEDTLCALLFNASGYLHEHLKAKRRTA